MLLQSKLIGTDGSNGGFDETGGRGDDQNGNDEGSESAVRLVDDTGKRGDNENDMTDLNCIRRCQLSCLSRLKKWGSKLTAPRTVPEQRTVQLVMISQI